MFDCFLAHILVLIMILVCTTRIFFLKDARVDSFAVFAPLSFVTSLFVFLCFDFSALTFAVFALATAVFFTNFRAVLRLSASLIVDTYNPVFIISTILEFILTILLAALIVYVRPVRYTEKDFSVTRTQYTLTGASTSLRIRESPFTGERFSGNLFVYEPIVHDEIDAELYSENPVLIFAPGIRATVQNYEPYLMILAQWGFKVLAADLYTDDLVLLAPLTENKTVQRLLDTKFLRRFAALQFEARRPEEFQNIIEAEKPLATKKYAALTRLAFELFGDEANVFYIVDGVDFDSIYAVIDEFNTEPYSNARGFFAMNRVAEYETSGYGFIEQTDVLLAREKGIPRENKFFIARYVANKTVQAIAEKRLAK